MNKAFQPPKIFLELTVPVLNEEDGLLPQLATLENFASRNLLGFGEVGFVIGDNGSTDRTPELALQLIAGSPKYRYVRVEEPGVGAALKESWSSSSARFVGYVDLDLATDLLHLEQALEILSRGDAEIVNGSRLLPGSKVFERKWYRDVLSKIFNRIVRLVFFAKFTDGMCGFKILDRERFIESFLLDEMSDGWFFATELLVRADRAGLKISEIPVTWTDDHDSKVKPLKLALQYLREILRLAYSLSRRFERGKIK